MEAATATGPAVARPAPSVQLRGYLERCRLRDMSFDMAWAKSMRAIQWPHDTRQREDWRAALRDTREEWRACYHGEITDAATRMRDFEVQAFVPSLPDLDGLQGAAAL